MSPVPLVPREVLATGRAVLRDLDLARSGITDLVGLLAVEESVAEILAVRGPSRRLAAVRHPALILARDGLESRAALDFLRRMVAHAEVANVFGAHRLVLFEAFVRGPGVALDLSRVSPLDRHQRDSLVFGTKKKIQKRNDRCDGENDDGHLLPILADRHDGLVIEVDRSVTTLRIMRPDRLSRRIP